MSQESKVLTASTAARIKFITPFIKGIGKVLREEFARRNARIDALEQRIGALEAKPSVQDKGIWRAGQVYEPGDIVTRSGSAWICRSIHMAVGDDLDHDRFRLLVKRGRDGKDLR